MAPVVALCTNKTGEGAELFLWFVQKRCEFRSERAKTFLLAPVKLGHRFYSAFPKRNCLVKIIHVHSLRLLEIAPKPCYKKLHPK